MQFAWVMRPNASYSCVELGSAENRYISLGTIEDQYLKGEMCFLLLNKESCVEYKFYRCRGTAAFFS